MFLALELSDTFSFILHVGHESKKLIHSYKVMDQKLSSNIHVT